MLMNGGVAGVGIAIDDTFTSLERTEGYKIILPVGQNDSTKLLFLFVLFCVPW
jgi:hypothetical protein